MAEVEPHSGYKYYAYMCTLIHACIMSLHAAIGLDLNIVEFSACVFLCVFPCKPIHR